MNKYSHLLIKFHNCYCALKYLFFSLIFSMSMMAKADNPPKAVISLSTKMFKTHGEKFQNPAINLEKVIYYGINLDEPLIKGRKRILPNQAAELFLAVFLSPNASNEGIILQQHYGSNHDFSVILNSILARNFLDQTPEEMNSLNSSRYLSNLHEDYKKLRAALLEITMARSILNEFKSKLNNHISVREYEEYQFERDFEIVFLEKTADSIVNLYMYLGLAAAIEKLERTQEGFQLSEVKSLIKKSLATKISEISIRVKSWDQLSDHESFSLTTLFLHKLFQSYIDVWGQDAQVVLNRLAKSYLNDGFYHDNRSYQMLQPPPRTSNSYTNVVVAAGLGALTGASAGYLINELYLNLNTDYFLDAMTFLGVPGALSVALGYVTGKFMNRVEVDKAKSNLELDLKRHHNLDTFTSLHAVGLALGKCQKVLED